eukprot:scaffold4708_cov128-Isochrysis_galbana.AAC.5
MASSPQGQIPAPTPSPAALACPGVRRGWCAPTSCAAAGGPLRGLGHRAVNTMMSCECWDEAVVPPQAALQLSALFEVWGMEL